MKPYAILGTISLALITLACVHSCDAERTQYYLAMNKCTEAHGTWIPQGDTIYGAMCIYPH